MKGYSMLKYFIFMVLIFIAVFFGGDILSSIREEYHKNMEINIPFLNLISVLVYGVLGVVLGIDNFLYERKKEGKWMINLPKIIFIVLPALYFSFGPSIYMSNIGVSYDILSYPIGELMVKGDNYISIFQVILGYSVITSFQKSNR